MSKSFYHKRIFISFLLLILIMILESIFSVPKSQAFSEPTRPAPFGNVAAPINISSTAQYKVGALKIGSDNLPGDGNMLEVVGNVKIEEGSLTVSGDLKVGESSSSSDKICLNDNGDGSNCISNWSEIQPQGNFVSLQQADTETGEVPDSGFVSVVAKDAPWQQWAIKGKASISSSESDASYGLFGVSSDDANKPSFGVMGQASQNSWGHAGIYGYAPFLQAYAGYFYGNVGIKDGNLYMMSTNPNKPAQICFYNNGTLDCASRWPEAKDLWTQRNINNLILTYLNNQTSHLALGGNDGNAPIYFNPNGPKMVIGVPTGSSETCGDGACQTLRGETVNNCPLDCY